MLCHWVCRRRALSTPLIQNPPKMFTQKDRVELEELMDCNKPIHSTVVPRWKRKALQRAQQAAAASTPSKSAAPAAIMSASKGTPKVSISRVLLAANANRAKSVEANHRV